MSTNLKNSKYFKLCRINKKYLALYFIFTLVSFLSMMTIENYAYPFAELLIFILVFIL